MQLQRSSWPIQRLSGVWALLLAAGLIWLSQPVNASPSGQGPTWAELTPAQRLSLQPLQSQWQAIDPLRKKKWLENLPPFNGGGEMIRDVTTEGFTTNDIPWKFEAGTPAIAQAIALGTAIEWIEQVGLIAAHEYEQGLTQRAWDALMQIPGMKIYGPPPSQRGGILSFTLAGGRAAAERCRPCRA